MTRAPKLTEQVVAQWCQHNSHWLYREQKLYQKLQFNDFNEAFSFMVRVAMVAEKMNHHPDWYNSYRTVEVTLCSHDIGGLSERDLSMAAFIDSIAPPVR